MARVKNFFNWVIIVFLAFVAMPVCYYYLWLLLKEHYKVVFVTVIIYTLVDLFILVPIRERDVRDNREERLKKLRGF